MIKSLENMKWRFSVSKNSNSATSLKAKQLQQSFQGFCKIEWTLLLQKYQKLIKIQENL